jgi:Meckel syndrome type 1 protein
MNDEPRDREIEQAYRDASTETPPPELDARILAAAHRAVGARPAGAERPRHWLDRYRIPLSVAATALIAVTLSVMVEDETRRPADAEVPGAAPPAASESRKSDAPWGSRSAPAERSAPAASPPVERPTERGGASRAPSDAQDRREAPVSDNAGANVTAPAAPAPPAPASATSSAPLSAPAAGPASGETSAPGMAARERTLQERPSRMTRDEAGPTAERALPQGAAIQSPEAWLAEIRRLRAEGRLTEADVALASFRREYPDYTLPEDLRRP